ncbi:MAG: rod shape-determining protein MreC [Firmicutes bacterium]|jgi:rod shape-determining protein MreC|nr:rod shape-determining protein MreC [Bacillota bacterium]NBI63643.1 rod shape-determining protein MreC [Clostridiales bacterium]
MRENHGKKKIIIICAAAAVLIAAAVFFKAAGSSYGIKGTMQNAAAMVTEPVSQAIQGIKDGFRGIFRFKQVVAENESLKQEIQQLRLEQSELEMTRNEKEELKELQSVFHCEALAERRAVAADVTALDYTGQQGVIIIDKGSQDGVEAGSCVVSGDGVVGRITQVSERSAKVASLLAEKSKVSFQVKGKKKKTGVVESDGKDGLTGYVLEAKGTVKQGDELVTSGIGTYPEALKIGEVEKAEKKNGTQMLTIQVTPAVSFSSLKKVAVIL